MVCTTRTLEMKRKVINKMLVASGRLFAFSTRANEEEAEVEPEDRAYRRRNKKGSNK